VTPINFVEGGGASSILAIADYAGVPLAETQKELTPLQRMVIEKEAKRQQEEADNGQHGHGSAGTSAGRMNPKAAHKTGGPSGMEGETVEYVNNGTGD